MMMIVANTLGGPVPDDLKEALPLLIGFHLLLSVVGLWFYSRRLRRPVGLANEGLGVPDLAFVGTIIVFLAAVVMSVLFFGGAKPEGEEVAELGVSAEAIYQTWTLLGVTIAGIYGFLKWRKISWAEVLGLGRIGLWRGVGQGLLFILATLPLVWLTASLNLLYHAHTDLALEPQEVLVFFQGAVADEQYFLIALVAFSAVIVAPVLEELIFRGYFHATLRRYLGRWVAVVLSSLLFAVIHANSFAFPVLVVLAICLALAYEASGTIMVPMVMHLVFNGISIGLLYVSAS